MDVDTLDEEADETQEKYAVDEERETEDAQSIMNAERCVRREVAERTCRVACVFGLDSAETAMLSSRKTVSRGERAKWIREKRREEGERSERSLNERSSESRAFHAAFSVQQGARVANTGRWSWSGNVRWPYGCEAGQ